MLPNGMPATETFRPDGTFTIAVPNKELPSMIIDMIGKYHENGDQLYMTFTDVQFENMPDALKGQEQKLKDDMLKTIEVGKEKVATMRWTGDTAFETSTTEGNKATFKKKG